MAYLPQLTIGAAGFGENFTTIGLVQQVLDVLLANDHITVDTHDKSHPPTDMGMPTHGFKIEGILLTTGMSRYIHLLPVTIETSANMTFDCLRLEPSEHFHFQTRAGLNADYRSVPYNNVSRFVTAALAHVLTSCFLDASNVLRPQCLCTIRP